MSNPYFKFKKFTVWHDKCAMKVGTDGALLGAWVRPQPAARLLDVGTGTGLIALMLAQRTDATVDAIDIDADACLQARENVEASPFAGRIEVHHASLEAYATSCRRRYDLIVSNPPFFVRSLKCPDPQRNIARHTDRLTLPDLLRASRCLLNPDGRIALVLPADQQGSLEEACGREGLFIIRQTLVFPTPKPVPKRLLAELAGQPEGASAPSVLTIEDETKSYTPGFRELMRDFYLKL